MNCMPTVLSITKLHETQYRFTLSNPGEPFLGPLQRIFEVKVNPAVLNVLGNRIIESAKQANLEGDISNVHIESFKKSGKLLYSNIFPKRGGAQPLIDELALVNTPLLINTDDPNILWELMYDGTDFLGIKFITGRRLKTSMVPPGVPKKRKEWRCLVISNPTCDLDETELETSKLVEALQRKDVICDYLNGSDANLAELIIKLDENEYDIIHYAGHIVYDDSAKQYALRLNNNELFWAINIRNEVKGSPIVFLNGCWSACEVKSHTDSLHSMESLTEAFLETGARLVVGSLFEIPDEGARIFAEVFYDNVLNGEMVGEALRKARYITMEDRKYGATWASFIMYGDPCLQVEFKKDEIEELLNTINMTRKDFDISASRIIEQTVMYGKESGRISTVHLFAAIIADENSEIAKTLNYQKIPAEKLKNAFQKIFSIAEDLDFEKSDKKKIKFSTNLEAILEYAKEQIKNNDKEKITVSDLNNAFSERAGGPTLQILKKLGVDFQKNKEETATSESKTSKTSPYDIRIEWPRPSPPEYLRNKDAYSSLAWEVLRCSIESAIKAHSMIISTFHLFMGLLLGPCFLIYRTLRQQGFSPFQLLISISDIIENEIDTIIDHSSIRFSENVKRILIRADEIAKELNQDKVNDTDLFTAFIQTGGGGTGKLLSQLGIELSTIFYPIFTIDGEIDKNFVDEKIYSIFQKSEDYANRIKCGFVSRPHLFYGICSIPNSKIKDYLPDIVIKLDELDNAIQQILGITENGPKINFELPFMTLGLKQTLILASNICKKENSQKITEDHFIKALLTPTQSSIKTLLNRLK
ncbi:MAG: CHAT domain-containing protein [Candidatus Lokiarchaeota archaeon]|nr:CHAT domain-containing protein [Candidatus Lokiarchaeota archaeon]